MANIIELEKYEYSDAITELILILQQDFDFEMALSTLARCEVQIKQDYFLAGLANDFVENARAAIFQTQASLHSSLNIPTICQKLGVSNEDAVISELVRNSRLSAKIDVERSAIVMNTPQVLVWQSIEERTKDLAFKTFSLVNGIIGMQQEGLLG